MEKGSRIQRGQASKILSCHATRKGRYQAQASKTNAVKDWSAVVNTPTWQQQLVDEIKAQSDEALLKDYLVHEQSDSTSTSSASATHSQSTINNQTSLSTMAMVTQALNANAPQATEFSANLMSATLDKAADIAQNSTLPALKTNYQYAQNAMLNAWDAMKSYETGLATYGPSGFSNLSTLDAYKAAVTQYATQTASYSWDILKARAASSLGVIGGIIDIADAEHEIYTASPQEQELVQYQQTGKLIGTWVGIGLVGIPGLETGPVDVFLSAAAGYTLGKLGSAIGTGVYTVKYNVVEPLKEDTEEWIHQFSR